MNKFIVALKENKRIIILSIIIIIAFIVLFIYNSQEKDKTYNPNITEIDVEYIKKNYEVNEYRVIEMKEADLLNAYLKKYLQYTANNIDKAYAMLSDQSKNSFNNDINEYKKYINDNTSINTKNNEVVKYRKSEGNNTYEVVDSEKYKYIIKEDAIWDIKITLNGRE